MSDAGGALCWRDLVHEARAALGKSLGGDRGTEARWIVERVSGWSSSELRANERDAVPTRAVAFFDQLVGRRCAGEPLQYVLGRWGFRTLELVVDPRVLIPRPETEVVAGLAIAAAAAAVARGVDRPLAVDIGTGSGAIALSLAAEVPGLEVVATDVSEAALAVASANLSGMGGRAAARVRLLAGSWFDALPADVRGRVDVLVSNPPYVGLDESAELAAEVLDWEPSGALFAGVDGSDAWRHLVVVAPSWLRDGGVLVVEIAPRHADDARAAATANGFTDVRIVDDLSGRARALVATGRG